jgi:hypothetical protein
VNDIPQFILTLALDFDGVVHQHVSKWTGPLDIHDPPVPGAFEFMRDLLSAGWRIYIHTTRFTHSIDPDLTDIEEIELAPRVAAVLYWFETHGFQDICQLVEEKRVVLWTSGGKPPAYFYLDDHAVRFEGTFPTQGELLDQRWPWNKGPKKTLMLGRAVGKSTDITRSAWTKQWQEHLARSAAVDKFFEDPHDQTILTLFISASCSLCGCPIPKGRPRWVNLWEGLSGETTVSHMHRACRCITDEGGWDSWTTQDTLTDHLFALIPDNGEGCAVTDLPAEPMMLDVVQDEYHAEWREIWAQLCR